MTQDINAALDEISEALQTLLDNCSRKAYDDLGKIHQSAQSRVDDLRELQSHAPEDAKGDEKPEWFFRWAARAMAGHTPYENAISTIFNHPGNPYAENNPWASPQPEHDKTGGE